MNRRLKATLMLSLATLGWGLSFPLYKALALSQLQVFAALRPSELIPSTWFFSGYSLFLRFTVSALILFIFFYKKIREFNRDELSQGLGLGFFGGVGTLFQMDALNYTAASTTAFLTQCYCLIIPVYLALRHRKLPSLRVFLSCVLVLIGVAILSGMTWQDLNLGRGEAETLVCSALFSALILWVERPRYKNNRWGPATFFMFVVTSLIMAVLTIWNSSSSADFTLAYSTAPQLWAALALALFPTLFAYVLMNLWQPLVSATQAALIYCGEPLFGSLGALVLPAIFSGYFAVNYPNETISASLLWGGGLILLANVLMIFDHDKSRN